MDTEMKDAHQRAAERIDALGASDLVTQMILVSEIMQAHGRSAGFQYPNFYEAVLALGTEKHIDEFYMPDGMEYGEPKHCYVNAAMLALANPEYTYVEGYAAADDLGIAMSHAWVEDSEGRIIDNTWAGLDREAGASYYGIRFSTGYLRERWEQQKMYFGGLLGENWGYYSHIANGMVVDEDGTVIGEAA